MKVFHRTENVIFGLNLLTIFKTFFHACGINHRARRIGPKVCPFDNPRAAQKVGMNGHHPIRPELRRQIRTTPE